MIEQVAFSDWEEKFNQLVEAKQPFIAVFTSQKEPNGETWCPDCKASAPFIPEIAESANKKGWKTYMFYVGPREVYKTPDHPFRTNPLIKLKCIPTVAYFDGKSFPRRLQEGEILKNGMRSLLIEG